MQKTNFSSYWDRINQNAKEKTNKKLGMSIRLLSIIVGYMPTIFLSIYSGNRIWYSVICAISNTIVLVLIWYLIWFGFFVYYRAIESVDIYYEQKNRIDTFELVSSPKVSIIAAKSQNINQGKFTFEQVKLINGTEYILDSCFVIIENFFEISQFANIIIEPTSRNISWSTNGRRTSDNKLNLLRGIPENLFIVSSDCEGNFFLMGEGGNNTRLEKGKSYYLQLRLVGNNFSDHSMTIEFTCNDDGSVDITKITNPSLMDFWKIPMKMGNLDIKPTISQ